MHIHREYLGAIGHRPMRQNIKISNCKWPAQMVWSTDSICEMPPFKRPIIHELFCDTHKASSVGHFQCCAFSTSSTATVARCAVVVVFFFFFILIFFGCFFCTLYLLFFSRCLFIPLIALSYNVLCCFCTGSSHRFSPVSSLMKHIICFQIKCQTIFIINAHRLNFWCRLSLLFCALQLHLCSPIHLHSANREKCST